MFILLTVNPLVSFTLISFVVTQKKEEMCFSLLSVCPLSLFPSQEISLQSSGQEFSQVKQKKLTEVLAFTDSLSKT